MWSNLKNNLNLVLTSPKDYLYSFSSGNEKVVIKPFKIDLYIKAVQILNEIKNICPDLKLNLIGSVGLQIEGRGDIDIYAGVKKCFLRDCCRKLEENFGPPAKVRINYSDWKFIYKNIPVELRVSDESYVVYQRQLKLFRLLKNNTEYLNQYCKIKKSFNGHPVREYVQARMVFFNKILRSDNY